jgi:hypothetical protein
MTSLALLYYTQLRYSSRSPPSIRTTDEVTSGCFLVSLILSLISAAVSGITHSGVLSTLAIQRKQKRVSAESSVSTGQQRLETLQKAITEVQSHDDALFWFVCFLCPSLVSANMGTMIFVWSEHALGVAIAVTIALVYGIVQAGRVVSGLAKAAMA